MSDYTVVPREEIKCPDCGEKVVKHVLKEGARYHVPCWSSQGWRCSEPDCQMNHTHVCKKKRAVTS